jgi:hypothetical protein
VSSDFTAIQVSLLRGIVTLPVNNKVEGIWTKSVVANFKVLSQLLPGWTEEKPRFKPSISQMQSLNADHCMTTFSQQ